MATVWWAAVVDTNEAKRTTEGPHTLGKGRGKGQREQAGLDALHRGTERGHVVGKAPACRPGRSAPRCPVREEGRESPLPRVCPPCSKCCLTETNDQWGFRNDSLLS